MTAIFSAVVVCFPFSISLMWLFAIPTTALYYGDYQVELAPTEEHKRLQKENESLWEQAERSMGEEAMNQLWLNCVGIKDEEGLVHFKEGFRLGAMLMLELLWLPRQTAE